MLVHKYELFKIESNATIFEMFSRFIDIKNGLKSLGKIYTNVKLMKKILRCLPKSWGSKGTAIKAKDLTKMGLDELLRSLMTYGSLHTKIQQNVKGRPIP